MLETSGTCAIPDIPGRAENLIENQEIITKRMPGIHEMPCREELVGIEIFERVERRGMTEIEL